MQHHYINHSLSDGIIRCFSHPALHWLVCVAVCDVWLYLCSYVGSVAPASVASNPAMEYLDQLDECNIDFNGFVNLNELMQNYKQWVSKGIILIFFCHKFWSTHKLGMCNFYLILPSYSFYDVLIFISFCCWVNFISTKLCLTCTLSGKCNNLYFSHLSF